MAGVKRSGVYAKGLWIRLNGGGKAGLNDALPLELPKPVSSKVDQNPFTAVRKTHVCHCIVQVAICVSFPYMTVR